MIHFSVQDMPCYYTDQHYLSTRAYSSLRSALAWAAIIFSLDRSLVSMNLLTLVAYLKSMFVLPIRIQQTVNFWLILDFFNFCCFYFLFPSSCELFVSFLCLSLLSFLLYFYPGSSLLDHRPPGNFSLVSPGCLCLMQMMDLDLCSLGATIRIIAH